MLKGCESRISRALKKDVTYFLCNDYEDLYNERNDWVNISKKNIENVEPPKDFFLIPSEIEGQKKRKQAPTINISAIVGKNGDGKSSLIELMLRIIYNFSETYQFSKDQESSVQIQGVKAILYYEIDGKLFNIRCSNGRTIASFAKQDDKETLKRHQDLLFYTIVANYSIYAYNSRNFEIESGGTECWINGVFHKNDGYQMPLVLNPMRTEGNFDVNNEEDLCRQRLMALFADLGNDPTEFKAREINEKKIALGVALKLEKKSKLETSTLRTYFLSTWKSTALKRFSDFFINYIPNINKGAQYKENAKKLFKGQVSFWLDYSKHWQKYSSLFKLAQKVMEQIYEDNKENEHEETDLKQYLQEARKSFKSLVTNKENRNQILASLDAVIDLTSSVYLTGLQFQHLVLIIDICELWYNHPWFSNYSFSEDIRKYVEGDKERDEGSLARLYVIYKTISIFSQYERFQDIFYINARYIYLFDGLEDEGGYKMNLKRCFELLFTDKNQQYVEEKYDTLKLRQTINYLRYQTFDTNRIDDDQIGRDFGFNYFVTFDKLQDFIKKAKEKTEIDEETIALLPPPIFESEILVEEGNHTFRMSDLSSGELQMLNSISTYIYHLRNLNYHLDAKSSIEYSYVNLILEEVELYFHPEYQRQYIYQMMQWIEQAKLDNIKAINIIIVTHSPIVLTDIPKNNVLFLKKGKPVYVMQENTFGANIHALLQNGFFLEGVPMGEFAEIKINNMFKRLHEGDCSKELFEEIKLVSEPLLKTQLYKLFGLNKSINSIQYKNLQERIEQLEKKLELYGGH